MKTRIPLLRHFDVTTTATNRLIQDADIEPRQRIGRYAQVFSSFGTSSSWTDLGQGFDPEEAVLDRLRKAEQATRRAEAHARIAAKRAATSVDKLLSLLERPEYKIEVGAAVLKEILDSYPEDD